MELQDSGLTHATIWFGMWIKRKYLRIRTSFDFCLKKFRLFQNSRFLYFLASVSYLNKNLPCSSKPISKLYRLPEVRSSIYSKTACQQGSTILIWLDFHHYWGSRQVNNTCVATHIFVISIRYLEHCAVKKYYRKNETLSYTCWNRYESNFGILVS